jgi:16S rRNA (cytosine967-C5)-methyltransferase
VQRWRLTLDVLISHFAKRRAGKLDPEVLDILRIGAYQLLHLTRVPASAVVDDAVKMARRFRKNSASGFVNAVLRSMSRGRAELPLPARPPAGASREQKVHYLSVSLSHPQWLAERWLDRLGLDAAEQWMRFNNEPAPLTLRANRLKIEPEALHTLLLAQEVVATRARFEPDAIVVQTGSAMRSVDLAVGAFVVQDEASQLVARLVGERPGRRVLDACAAPGGKATAIAARMAAGGPGGIVVACDVRDKRMALLSSTVRTVGAENVQLVQADLSAPLPFRDAFDTVLVDAPCSGLGTLRRDPDIKWHRTEADLAVLAAAQQRMLRNAAAAVARGGRLIYATCSTEPEENEAVVTAFLAGHPGFRAVTAAGIDPVLTAVVDEAGHLRTTPHQHQLEGFFGAVLERFV